jgi:MFS family permease
MLSATPFLRATITNFFFFASLNGFVLLPLYIQRLGGTEIDVGIVMGLYSAVGIVCQPLVGPWVDAVGRKPFMLLGVGLVAGSCGLAMVAPAIGALAVVRIVQGVGFSAFFVANFAYVIDLVPPARRGWALGIYGVSGLASTALAPLLGEWVIRRFGFPPLFAVSLVLALVALVMVHGMREDRHGEQPPARGLDMVREGVADLVQRHMAVAVFFGLGTGTVFAFLPTFAEELGVTTLALFYTAYAGAAMAVRVFGGRLIDTRGRRAVIVPSMFVQSAAAALLAALAFGVTRTSRLPVVPFLAIAGLMSGGAHGFVYPGLAALVADQAAETRRAAVVGVFSAVFLVGQATGAFVFGYVTHGFGYGVMWTALAVLLLLGAYLSVGLAAQHAP